MNHPSYSIQKLFVLILMLVVAVGSFSKASAALDVAVEAVENASNNLEVDMKVRFDDIQPDVPAVYNRARVSVEMNGVSIPDVFEYKKGDTLPMTKVFSGSMVPGKTYQYRFRTEFLYDDFSASTMHYPLLSQNTLSFTAVPDESAGSEGADKTIDAIITLNAKSAVINLKGTHPYIPGAIKLTLLGGASPTNLSLFGGTVTIPSGTSFPTTLTIPFNNATLLADVEYYVRLYVDGGNTHLVFPGATNPPIKLSLGESSTETDGMPTAVGDGPAAPEIPAGSGAGNTETGSSTVPTGGLVPCGNPGQAMCGFGDILKLVSNVVNYVFALIIPVSAAMFMIIGFQYMTSGGQVELKTLLKARLGNLILGIVIIMCAWLVMATILRTLGVDDAYILLDL